MRSYGVKPNILRIVIYFLSKHKQCVRVNQTFSEYVSVNVGAPQGTKLGPILWLFYVNDLSVEGYNCVKYADDTSFYKTVFSPDEDNVARAILTAQEWSMKNSMLLNSDKTQIMNILINHRYNYDDELFVHDDFSIQPTECIKFLGLFIDDHLNFSKHIDEVVSKCDKRIFLLRQLKILGMNATGLKTFYCSNIRSVLSYAAPAFYTMLSDHDKSRIERIQRTCTRVIFPDLEYEQRIEKLDIPLLCDFLHDLGARHFCRIASDPSHPLFDRICFNQGRMSLRRKATTYRPKRANTQKRAKSFFNFYMSHFNS